MRTIDKCSGNTSGQRVSEQLVTSAMMKLGKINVNDDDPANGRTDCASPVCQRPLHVEHRRSEVTNTRTRAF